jgi:BspA type Leucine rich repeat region (6 copies)
MSSRPLFNLRAFLAIVTVASSSFLALSGVASATSFVTLDGLTYLLSDTAPYIASVTGHNSLVPSEVIVPSTVTFGNSYSVTSIGNWAFQGDTALTSVAIPNSVTSIGNGAFGNDTSLTSVTIGNSVTTISGYAFYGDTLLASIIIPSSVTSIGGNAFSGDTVLTLSNPTDYVATWTGTGGPYTTAQLKDALAISSVTGTWASVVRVAPIIYSKPTAPSNVSASLSNGTATVSFTPGSSGNLATYDEIDMFINGQLVGNVCNVTGATSCPISNLGPDAVFSFTVTAINTKGSAVSTVSNTVSYSSPAVVTTTTTSPPTTTTTVPPVKHTITCVKGKTTKKITALSPVCPAGYKKK